MPLPLDEETDVSPPVVYTPMQDIPGAMQYYRFGSTRVGGCNFAICDGSVHSVSYAIDAEVHRRLGNRKDGLPIDGKQF